jgi:hypothetical protein
VFFLLEMSTERLFSRKRALEAGQGELEAKQPERPGLVWSPASSPA